MWKKNLADPKHWAFIWLAALITSLTDLAIPRHPVIEMLMNIATVLALFYIVYRRPQ